jgi:hypothetical protein
MMVRLAEQKIVVVQPLVEAPDSAASAGLMEFRRLTAFREL